MGRLLLRLCRQGDLTRNGPDKTGQLTGHGHRLAAAGDSAQVAHFPVPACLVQTDDDAVLVDVQSCKQGGKLTHGSSP